MERIYAERLVWVTVAVALLAALIFALIQAG
jgi:hypothetical protein